MLHMPLWLPTLCLLHHTEQCSACGRLFLKRMKTLDCFDCKNCGKKSILKNFRRSWIRQSAAHSFIIKILLNSIHHRNRFLNRDAPDRIYRDWLIGSTHPRPSILSLSLSATGVITKYDSIKVVYHLLLERATALLLHSATAFLFFNKKCSISIYFGL